MRYLGIVRKPMEYHNTPAKQVAFMGMLLAVALTLSYLEMVVAPLLGLAPGIKLGLANVAGMYALFCLGPKQAITLSVLRSVFVLLLRGVNAFLLSLSGGLSAVLVSIILYRLFEKKLSYISYSVTGAVVHNLMQLFMAGVLLKTTIYYYGPVLIVAGIIVGVTTGLTLQAVMPAVEKIQEKL